MSSFLQNLRAQSQNAAEQLKTKKDQFKNKDFSRASMAICAQIAAADGTVDADEKQKTAALITSNDTLSIFSASDLRDQFTHFVSKLEADYDFGKVEAIQAIAKLKKKEDQARAIIQIGIIIGGADGTFDENEQQAVREACNAVGINPAEFSL